MKRLFTILMLPLVFFHCGSSSENPKTHVKKTSEHSRLQVAVSILPQKFFIRQILDSSVDIQVMIPPGYSPATYSPTPGQIRKLKDVSLYFKVGYLPFENFWIGKLKSATPNMKVIDTSEGIHHIDAHAHHHEHKNEKSHSGIDPHTWLSPKAVKSQCQIIRDTLLESVPVDKKPVITMNYQRFMAKIDQLDLELNVIFKPFRNQTLLVFHPAWGYFARDYGLSQLAIESEGKEPTPKRLIHLIKEAGIKKNPVIFVQKQFDRHSAQAIADEIQGKVIILDPLAENWIKNMREMSLAISQHLNSMEKSHSYE